MTSLVFNCHYNGLALIQELGRHGIEVLALDSVRSIGTHSRYARFFRCPDPQVSEDEFVSYLLDLASIFRCKPVLFPTNDHWAVAVSRHKAVLSEKYICCVGDWPVVRLVIEKQGFYEWAMARAYPVPQSWRGTQFRDIPDCAFPLAAKPEYRRIASNDTANADRAKLMDQMRLTVLRHRADLNAFVVRHSELLRHLIFQEYIEGLSDCMYTVGVYASRDYEVLGMFTGRKVRGFPPDVGDCVVGQNEAVPEYLRSLVRRACKELNFHGIAEFEFKRDEISGEFKLIEINPRSWSWIGITPACNVSLGWIAYCDLTGRKWEAEESSLPDGSVKYIKLLEDLPNCLYSNRRAGYPQWHMSLRHWWRSVRASKIIWAEFTWDDPWPGVHAICEAVRTRVRKRFLRVR